MAKPITKKQFDELLAAAFNISPTTEAGSRAGELLTEAALSAADRLFEIASRGTSQLEGVLLVARLLVECYEAERPVDYVKMEIARGWSGHRHEFEKAGIRLKAIKRSSANVSV